MKNIWRQISYMGINENENNLQTRSIVLTNRINFILLLVMLFFIVYTTITRELSGGKMTMGTFRLDLILATNLFIILLSLLRKHQWAKYALIFFPTLFYVLVPYFFNFYETESFILNPIVIIAFSIVPPLVIVPSRKKWVLRSFLLYFLLLLIFNNLIIKTFAPKDLPFLSMLQQFDALFILAPVASFVFIHLAIYYLRNINWLYQERLINNFNELQTTLIDLKKTQQQLIESEKMASVGNLTSGIAHEISTPMDLINGGLNTIQGNLSSIQYSDETQKEKIRRSIQMIDEGSQRASNIVQSLAAFSFKGVSQLANIHVEEVIEKTLLLLKVKLSPDIRIEKEFHLNEAVPAYKEKLQQVILNILDNAISVLQNDGKNTAKKISIKTEKEGDFAQITIYNNGPFMAEEKLNSVFDPFFISENSDKDSGLGLAISYALIEEHKGYLFAENKKAGVAFMIKLPLHID